MEHTSQEHHVTDNHGGTGCLPGISVISAHSISVEIELRNSPLSAYQSSEQRKSRQSAINMSFTPGSSTIELIGRF